MEDVTSEEWKALGDAITKLHEKDAFGPQGPSTPSSQEPFPQSHDSYEWFVQIHGNRKEAKACKHGSESIWPWHRAFLLHFETRLRATNPPSSSNITLPYWDWTEKPSGQKGYPKMYEQTNTPFLHDREQYDKNDVPLIVASDAIPQGLTPQQFISKILEKEWKDFGGTAEGLQGRPGAMETQLHNEIHGYIGMDNANTIHAVRDPIFWAHHSNLDRLWDEWQKLHPDLQQCFACDAPVYDRDPAMGELKFRNVLSNDNLPGDVKVVYLPKGAQLRPPPLRLLAAGVVVRRIIAPPSGFVAYSLSVPESVGYRFEFRLIDVKVPKTHAYHAAIYLFPDSSSFSETADFAKKYKVGNFGMFGGGETEDHGSGETEHHSTQTLSVDLTDGFRAIPRDQIGKTWKLAIRFRVAAKSENYADIASEISVDHVELIRRDFATSGKIPLN